MPRDSRSQNHDKQKTNGFFRRAMPTMPMPLAVVCCLLNIITPGFGTLLAAFSVFCCARHKCDTNLKAFFTNVLAFFLQLLSALVIFGWVWSIRYGLMFIHMSSKRAFICYLSDFFEDLFVFVRRECAR
jgi:hypothetical protein